MKNFLKDYLELSEQDRQEIISNPGPVVTLSRESGCSSTQIAVKLSKILSGYGYQAGKRNGEWTLVSKEIIEEAAQELEMSHAQIKDVFRKETRTSLHDVTTAFSTDKVYDADDQKVIDTISEIISKVAQRGRCVIVGRAANVVTKDIPACLNVKLQAPMEWRIGQVMKVSSMNYADARDYVLEIDRQRNLFVEHIAGYKVGNSDFDVVFNCATMSDDLIVDTIINILKSKRLIAAG